ncbi:unnamed protein product [Soboliphyme baturini]|uniref:PDR_CDR domain-containing protein n=1 Tax=Soboliphyme baturini TaxID=241478 RepID=A0A183J3J6_9BILA|nr:unnamed protein product [Soboliphyme baturini]
MNSYYGSALVNPSVNVDEVKKNRSGIASCYCPRRYYLAVCAFIGFCLMYTMRVNLSIAVLYMKKSRMTRVGNETVDDK